MPASGLSGGPVERNSVVSTSFVKLAGGAMGLMSAFGNHVYPSGLLESGTIATTQVVVWNVRLQFHLVTFQLHPADTGFARLLRLQRQQ